MSLFGFSLKPRRAKTATQAKDRLQLLLAHERANGGDSPDFLPQLQRDLLEVIRKYIPIEDKDIDIHVERDDAISSLEINVEMSGATAKKTGA